MIRASGEQKLGSPLTVAVTTAIPHRNLDLLSPDASLRLGRCQILVNPPAGTACDFWIVFTTSRDRDHMVVAPENTLYAAGEPPSKKVHPRGFYAQFHHVHSCHPDDPHPRVHIGALCLNWHVGLDHSTSTYRFGHDHLSALVCPDKLPQLSVICSNLTATDGQRQRLEFLEALKAELGDLIVHFGKGFQPIPDKLDAILPYACHLVLENCRTPHYWSEKLADAYLGHAFPFYLGAPNLADHFARDAFEAVDPADPADAARRIRDALATGLHTRRAAALRHARGQILGDYNFFTHLGRLAETHHTLGATPRKVEVLSHKAFRPFPRNLLFRFKARRHTS